MTDSLTTLTGVLRGIAAANATSEYQQTVTDINGLVKVATAYETAGCATDPSADANGACFKDAMAIEVGAARVNLDMAMDEHSAGAS
ncbi:hypothetical protein [Actinacidiphila acididurans]|uniref:Uncharacterized protein n=1 Tax=Actinacidiphila acididurans TaxID=2784346 RepID=A0ABS2U2X6_9ACTN|nr:hypothetical protein [Actinacidiphila acididurans]MBM9509943.1 hypothetical protein [Actinacidiphila acididurans]